MRLTTRHPTYLRIAWEYRFADALPGRLDEHGQPPGPYAKRTGESARDSRIHAPLHTYTKREKQIQRTCDIVTRTSTAYSQRHQIRYYGDGQTSPVLRSPAHKRQDKPPIFFIPLAVPAGCMPTDYRFWTIRASWTSLVWSGPDFPKSFPALSMDDCALPLLLLAAVPAFLPTRHVCRTRSARCTPESRPPVSVVYHSCQGLQTG